MNQVLISNGAPPEQPLRPVRIPGSKSVSNRALVLAALAPGESILREGLEAEDTQAMRRALGVCGIPILEQGHCWTLGGGRFQAPQEPLPVGASGTTLRFLIPLLATQFEAPVAFHGDPRLFERPLEPLLKALEPWGVRWEARPSGGLLVPGRRPETLDTWVDPSLSSQFVTGLALAAAGLPGGGRLRWSQPPTSTSYLELTRHGLAAFGCVSRLGTSQWEIPGGCLRPVDRVLSGDWSGAAAFLAAGAVTGRRAEVHPLDGEEPQGDRAMLELLGSAGCRTGMEGHRAWAQGPLLRGLEADLRDCPDLGPVLAAVAALAPGPSVLRGLHTLPHKECDRLDASAELVRWLGGTCEVVGDHTLRIQPGPPPGERPAFDPRNDHRMAFAAAVGALRTGGRLLNPGCVGKTFPSFWDDWTHMLEG